MQRLTATCLSGMPQGKPGMTRAVSAADGMLRFEVVHGFFHKEYEPDFEIPLTSVTALQTADGQSISAGRVLATGLVGLAWKKKSHYLLVTYEDHGLASTMAMEFPVAAPVYIERLRQEIAAERAKAIDAARDPL